MAKPTILAVDDDLAVLSALTRDRQWYYGRTYRILRATSGAAALDITDRTRVGAVPMTHCPPDYATQKEQTDDLRTSRPNSGSNA